MTRSKCQMVQTTCTLSGVCVLTLAASHAFLKSSTNWPADSSECDGRTVQWSVSSCRSIFHPTLPIQTWYLQKHAIVHSEGKEVSTWPQNHDVYVMLFIVGQTLWYSDKFLQVQILHQTGQFLLSTFFYSFRFITIDDSIDYYALMHSSPLFLGKETVRRSLVSSFICLPRHFL